MHPGPAAIPTVRCHFAVPCRFRVVANASRLEGTPMGTEREYGIRVADRHSGRTYLLALRGESQRDVESAVAQAGWMVGPIEYEREAGPYTPTLVPPAPTGPGASPVNLPESAQAPDRREIAAGVKDGCLSAVWSVVRWPIMIVFGFVVVVIVLQLLNAT